VRALLVDDQRLARVLLRKLLEAHPQIQVVAEADSLDAAERALDVHAPDVIFLDIALGGASGFELLTRRRIDAKVVFVTAFDEHAVRAFEVHALDYLLKPVDPDRLAATIARLGEAPRARPDRFAVSEERQLRVVAAADILVVRAKRDYTELTLRDGATVTVKVPLARWQERLGDAFVRVHRSVLIAIADVASVDLRRNLVHLRGLAEPIQVGRRHLRGLKSRVPPRAW
jgi:two-component system LytT family response regulator